MVLKLVLMVSWVVWVCVVSILLMFLWVVFWVNCIVIGLKNCIGVSVVVWLEWVLVIGLVWLIWVLIVVFLVWIVLVSWCSFGIVCGCI